jgi:hypothetical protein
VRLHDIESLNALLQTKPQSMTIDQLWRTDRLVEAAIAGDVSNVEKYLSPEEKLESVNYFHRVLGMTALMGAAKFGHRNVVELLLFHKADVTSRRRVRKDTALHMACSTGKAGVVKCLLEHGADRTIQDLDGNLPLEVALLQGHDQMKDLLFGVPKTPKCAIITGVGCSKAKISWTIPDDNGAPIIDCTVQWRMSRKKGWNIRSGVKVNYCLLSGLKAAKRYEVIVRARNRAGPSLKSNPAVFETKSSTPSKPNPPYPFRQTASTLIIAWDPPSDNGYALERFELQYRYRKLNDKSNAKKGGKRKTRRGRGQNIAFARRGSDKALSSVLAASSQTETIQGWTTESRVTPFTRYEFNELQRRTWYMFRFRAKSSAGWGEWSNFSNAVETLDSPTICETNARSLFTKWRPVPNAHAYRVQYQIVNEKALNIISENWTTIHKNFEYPNQMVEIPDLLPATYYRVRIQDYNELFGWNPSANCSPVCTLHDRPEDAIEPWVVHTSTTSLRLKCHAPCCNGSNLHSLEYLCRPVESSAEAEECTETVACSVEWNGRMEELAGRKEILEFTVSKLMTFVNYTVSIRFQNEHGWGNWSEFCDPCKTEASAPEPPLNVRAADVTPLQIALEWDAPETDNGSPVQNYKLEMKTLSSSGPNQDDGLEWEVVSSELENKLLQVKGLDPGCRYQFRAYAANEIGWSKASVSSEVYETALLPPGVTDPPILIHANDRHLIIGWLPPTETGGANVESFEIQQRNSRRGVHPWERKDPPEAKDSEEQRPLLEHHPSKIDEESCDLSNQLYTWKSIGLVNNSRTKDVMVQFTASSLGSGVHYEFRVRSRNRKGFGPWGNRSKPFLTTANVPSVPSRAVVRKQFPNQMLIEWLPPVLMNGDEVNAYEVSLKRTQADPEGPSDWRTLSNPKEIMPLDGIKCQRYVTNLLADSSYRVRVRARNALGWSDWSEESKNMATTSRSPNGPLPPVINSFGNRSANLKWVPARQNGADIDMYELQRMTIGRTWESLGEWTVLMRDDCLAFNSEDLLPATNYSYRLRAHNAWGWGSPGENSIWFQTEPACPSVPTMPVEIFWDGSTLTMGWKHPAGPTDSSHDNGSAITFYEVERKEISVDQTRTEWEVIDRVKERFVDFKEAEPLALERWFRVRAKNACGYSEWSDAGHVVLRRLTEAEKKDTRSKKKRTASIKEVMSTQEQKNKVKQKLKRATMKIMLGNKLLGGKRR